ncbi:hypothetical protein PHYPSEUDO_012547 [Phytophthora pseudosyringae]|uniref:Uncharacterized protein n=1 Tax=Phytophthora pseudosyringae TaxID=221518 RepID=A0A8T1V7H6_9STRA|nr:hypothetical protein PHYPSEUDO_012547 [Phytophthora pseudosyringae]
MRADRGEEAAMLLSAYQQAAQRDAAGMRQRRRALRTLLAVVGALALFVGCIAAVDAFALSGGSGGDAMTLEVTTAGDEAVAMESQFGWNSIGYGWCSVKSSTWCMFSKDKDACKEKIKCYKNRTQSRAPGSGSGSGYVGNATVGDSSEVGSDPDDPVAAPVENPTQPLDLPSSGGEGSDDESGDNPEASGAESASHGEDEPQMAGED